MPPSRLVSRVLKVCTASTCRRTLWHIIRRLLSVSLAMEMRGIRSLARSRCLALLLGLVCFAWLAQAQQQPTHTPAPSQPGSEPRADVAAFRARVDAAMAAAGADRAFWGVLVADAATGEVLYELNPQRYFIPASNTKLFTSALALSVLGPEHRFRTTLETPGNLDRSGRLRGDLVLVGRGDPNLSNRKFPYAGKVERDGPPEKILAELADALVARNVRLIEGDIVADDSYFAYERFPSGWTIDDMLWGYGAAVSALSVNDNTIAVELRPGEREGEPAWFAVEPWADFYSVRNEARTGTAGSERKLEVSRQPGGREIVLRGTIPLNGEPHTLTLGVEEAAEHAASLLRRLLEARGVRIYGKARAQHAPETASGTRQVLAEHISPPLLEAVRALNKASLNLHAELLLRAAARERAGAVKADDALKFAQEYWKPIGIEDTEAVFEDGSGLSRRNLVTPQAVVRLLASIAKQPWGEAFASTLPIAGVDGTLTERMKNTSAAGRIRAKTGSLDHIRAISGYATTLRGERLIFAMFANNALRGKDADAVLDAICIAMVEELGPAPKGKP